MTFIVGLKIALKIFSFNSKNFVEVKKRKKLLVVKLALFALGISVA